MPLPTTGLDVLDGADCERLLSSGSLGRIIVSVNALPAAFPVNYRVHQNAIVFRTAGGTKLNRAMDATVVGFQADQIDAVSGAGWSVLVIGTATLVIDRDEIATLARLKIPSLAGDRLPHMVRISIQTISGRRIPGTTP